MNKPQLAPYEILGVSPQASPAEITTAFKVLAQIFHPDRFADSPAPVRDEAEVRMKALNEAYSLARKGFLINRPASAANGSSKKAQTRQSPGGPGGQAFVGVPWDVGVRDRASQAVKANEARRAKEREARNGQAIARPKPKKCPSVLTGLGLAQYTGNIVCKGCKSVQWLPNQWEDSLNTTVYFCEFCQQLLLAR